MVQGPTQSPTLRIVRLTPVVNALGTLIGGALGFSSRVELEHLGLSVWSGAGVHVYAAGDKGVMVWSSHLRPSHALCSPPFWRRR